MHITSEWSDTEAGREAQVVMKRELSKKAKLSIFKAVLVPILTYGHESWVMTERMRSQMQASEVIFFTKTRRSYTV